MPNKIRASPARSQGGIATPKRKNPRGSRSLCSPALSTASGRLTSLIDQFRDKNIESFALSPLNGQSVLNDNTDIVEPRRKSWWRKLDENSQSAMDEVLEDNKVANVNNIEELFDIEVLSQEKKNYTIDLPESSDNESIHSIVLPQRRLFTQKENQPQKNWFGELIANREKLTKLHKTTNDDKAVNTGTRELFQNAKRSKPIFPAALLNITPNKTAADKTEDNIVVEPKPQVKNIFGNRPAIKRKNMFADFVVSESEDEIPEIQAKVFCFQKKPEQRRISSASKGRDCSPSSSITTDMEMDSWKLLPSSTMVENQLEEMVAGHTPIKRARLSKLSEAKESEAGTNTLQTNTTADKTKQSNKSASSKSKSKSSPEVNGSLNNSKNTRSMLKNASKHEKNINRSLNNSKNTRSMLKNASKHEENVNTSKKQDSKGNKSQSKVSSKDVDESPSKSTDKQNTTLNKSQKENKSRTSEDNADEMNISQANEHNQSQEDLANQSQEVENESDKVNNDQVSENYEAHKSDENKDGADVNESKEIKAEVDHRQEVDEQANESLEMEAEVVQSHEVDEEANESQEMEAEKDQSQEVDEESNESQEMEAKEDQSQEVDEEANESQEMEAGVDHCQKVDEEANESQEMKAEVDQSQEVDERANVEEIDEEANGSQEVDEEANQSQDIEENASDKEINEDEEEAANESHEIEGNASDEENDDEISEKEEAANNSAVNETANESQEIENDEANSEIESDEVDEEENESQQMEAEEDQSHEVHEEANKSQEMEAEEDQSQEVDEEANESQEMEAVVDHSQEVDEEANESQEMEAEVDQSQEVDERANVEEIDEEANESREVDEEANQSQDIEENASDEEIYEDKEEAGNESHEIEGNASDEGNDDEISEKEEAANNSAVNETANESPEIENDVANSEIESEVENESEEIYDDQQMDDRVEADKAIASDDEISEQNDNTDEMLVDDDNEDQSEQNQDSSHEGQIDKQNESTEEIEESPNVTHDTTGRNRKKNLNKSLEVIRHDKTNQMDSFAAKGRNTSIRKTKSMIKNLNIRPSLAPPRDSTGFSDGTRNSSAEGSGWDSHRTTRKTLRQTFGKDFTPRKSLRTLVMEKSAKRQTAHLDLHSDTVKFPQANSTEFPEDSNRDVEDTVESDHEESRRMRQTTLEIYLQKIKQQNLEKNLQMEEAVRNSLKAPTRDPLNLFKMPTNPAPRRPKPAQSKAKKQIKSIIPFDELPSEFIEDMKYKPPKRFQPANASWITKRLYKFLETKLEPKYDYKARVRAEKLVETIYHFAKDLRRHSVAPTDAVEVLKQEFARLDVVHTHFEFYEFFHEFMPREVRVKVVPDIVNKISLPRHGVFSDILRGNTVQG